MIPLSQSISDKWPPHVIADYPHSAVRLTTILHNGATFLLFGYIELIPEEVPPPENYDAKKNFFNDLTVRMSLTVLSTADALAWYESAANGTVRLPRQDTELTIQAVRLEPEPAFGHFIAAQEPPVVAPWHNCPRMHRLVPMEELPLSVTMLLNQPETSDRRKTVRTWLEQHCFVDLTTHPDCAGGIILLAPNPILRRCSPRLLGILSDGSEAIGIRAVPRAGYGFSTLTIRLHEFRLDGRFCIVMIPIDESGKGKIILPQRASQLALEITCSVRGLLSVAKPYGFYRSIEFTSFITRANVNVEVPGRTKGATSSSHSVHMVQSGFVVRTGEEQQQNVTSRLALLQSARAAHPMDRESELVFISNRDDATAFVRGIVGRARQKVLFVDPYFSFTDIRQFALSVALDQCEIGFLTGRDEPKWQNELQAFTPPVVHGRAMLTDLMHINQLRTENGLSSVTARVMGGPARKYHDRFLVVDDEVWHFGHSFNAIGDGSITLVMKVLRPEKILPLIIDDFTSAVSFESYWAEALSTQNSSAIKDVNQDQVSQDPCAAHWASRALNYIRSLMSFRRSADAGDRADP